MPFADSIRSLIGDYQKLSLLANGAAVDYSRDRISTSKSTGSAPPDFGAEAVEVELFIERVAGVVRTRRLIAEGDRTLMQVGADVLPKTSRSQVSRSQSQAILAEQGMLLKDVADLYGWHVESVRKLRRRHGLDPITGERLPVALTAPARDTLRERGEL